MKILSDRIWGIRLAGCLALFLGSLPSSYGGKVDQAASQIAAYFNYNPYMIWSLQKDLLKQRFSKVHSYQPSGDHFFTPSEFGLNLTKQEVLAAFHMIHRGQLIRSVEGYSLLGTILSGFAEDPSIQHPFGWNISEFRKNAFRHAQASLNNTAVDRKRVIASACDIAWLLAVEENFPSAEQYFRSAEIYSHPCGLQGLHWLAQRSHWLAEQRHIPWSARYSPPDLPALPPSLALLAQIGIRQGQFERFRRHFFNPNDSFEAEVDNAEYEQPDLSTLSVFDPIEHEAENLRRAVLTPPPTESSESREMNFIYRVSDHLNTF